MPEDDNVEWPYTDGLEETFRQTHEVLLYGTLTWRDVELLIEELQENLDTYNDSK